MTFTEYLYILYSIIFGLIISNFLTGWGRLILDYKKKKLYWSHLFWSVIFFVETIQIYVASFKNEVDFNRLGSIIEWVSSPICLYFISLSLFYDRIIDYKKMFKERMAIIFTLSLIQISFDILNGLPYNRISIFGYINFIGVGVLIFLILTKKLIVSEILSVLGLAAILYLIISGFI